MSARYQLTVWYPGSGTWNTRHKRRQSAIDAAFAELDRYERAERRMGDDYGNALADHIGADRGKLASLIAGLAAQRTPTIVQSDFITIKRV